MKEHDMIKASKDLDEYMNERDVAVTHGPSIDRTVRTGWYSSGDILPKGRTVPDESDDVSIEDMIHITRILEARRWLINSIDNAVVKIIGRHGEYSVGRGTFIVRFPRISLNHGRGSELEIIAAEQEIISDVLSDRLYTMCPLEATLRLVEDVHVSAAQARSIVQSSEDPVISVSMANETWIDANGLWYVHASISEDARGIDFEVFSAMGDEHADEESSFIASAEGIPEDETMIIGPYSSRYEANCALTWFSEFCSGKVPNIHLLDELSRLYYLRMDHRFEELVE